MNIQSKKIPQRVHRALLLLGAEDFKNHKKGIPEWIKNSDDSYTRYENDSKINFSEIPILINFNKDEIICLDFGGSNAKAMIKHILYYGSPDAATQDSNLSSKKISGGHGNGGKYYALSQFKDCQIISYYLGKLTILRVNKDGDYIDYENKEISLKEVMNLIGIDKWSYFNTTKGHNIYNKLINKELNLFCWKGIGPKDKKQLSDKKSITQLLSSIRNNPQARSALRSRDVTILFNGNVLWPSMKPDKVILDESFGIHEFELPNKIETYLFNKYHHSTLKISLSNKPLTGEHSSLNILEIDAFGNNIAYYEIPQLLIDKGLSKSLYAHIDCPELRDDYNCVSNDRVHLIDGSEVTNLFLDWCKAKLKEVLEELTNKEKKKEERKHLVGLGTFLKEITDELKELLDEENIITHIFTSESINKELVDVPTNKPGFGNDGKINNNGEGQRGGGKEKKETNSKEQKNKSKLQILLSNHDPDPLNPDKSSRDMLEREPILSQRVEDVDHGIWWINSQKNYIKKINITDPGAKPFYFCLVKEIIFSQKMRKRFKENEEYDSDSLDTLNFDLIDKIFNKTVQRLGLDLSFDKTITEKIRNTINAKNEFTILELSNELMIESTSIHTFINNSSNGVLDTFKIIKGKINGMGSIVNMYVRK